MSNAALAYHFVAELMTARHQYARRPEPEAMDDAASVAAFTEATRPTGNGASVHLFNLIMLCSAIQPGMRVVDLACGPANLLVDLALMNPQAHFLGVDLSPEMLRHADTYRRLRGADNVDFALSDISDLAHVADGSIDLVMSTLSLHHMPDAEKLRQCIGEVGRVVKAAGEVYLMDFAALKRNASAKYFVEERTKGLNHYLKVDYINSLFAAFSREDLREAITPLSAKLPRLCWRQTWGVPFAALMTTLSSPRLTPQHAGALQTYWKQMGEQQRRDFKDLRLFFRLGGLTVPYPGA